MKKRREAPFYKGFRRFVGYYNQGHRTFLSYAWQLKTPLVTFLLFRY